MRLRSLLPFAVLVAVAACADIALSPSTPASIEFDPLSAPAVVLGDTLRDIGGVAAPARATVRNQAGEILTDASVRYTYADAGHDTLTAISVDSVKGFIVALKALTASPTARIAARAGTYLQAIRTVLITVRPDSVGRESTSRIDTLRPTLPDTGSGVSANTSVGLAVKVFHLEGAVVTQVPNWLVKFELIRPANPTNDTTANVFLVNEAQKASTLDTTDGSGSAARSVRVRSSKFPSGTALDSAVVRVTVSYKGKPVKGDSIRLVLPIIKKP